MKAFLILIISLCGLNLFGQLIPDDNFRAEINEHLGQAEDYEPSITDLNSLTGSVNAGSRNISSIEGAQYLINISKLQLYSNQIDDITPLSNLINLSTLNLKSNYINDISALSGLENLSKLFISGNHISDIYPLVENAGLGENDSLYISHYSTTNPLSSEALDDHIPLLQNRGFNYLWFPDSPDILSACYPFPNRNAEDVPCNSALRWYSIFWETTYYVYLGTTPYNLEYIGDGDMLWDYTCGIYPELQSNTHYYWRVLYDNDSRNGYWSGMWEFTTDDGLIANDELQIATYELSNYPNPFNPTTIVNFSIQNKSQINLSVFNTKGQKIKTLTNDILGSGDFSIVWNGDDEIGKSVSSGIYYYKLKVNGKTEVMKKCILLK
jgi:hypothetical protein